MHHCILSSRATSRLLREQFFDVHGQSQLKPGWDVGSGAATPNRTPDRDRSPAGTRGWIRHNTRTGSELIKPIWAVSTSTIVVKTCKLCFTVPSTFFCQASCQEAGARRNKQADDRSSGSRPGQRKAVAHTSEDLHVCSLGRDGELMEVEWPVAGVGLHRVWRTGA